MPLIPLSAKHCQALLEFETNNATFFEKTIPARPKNYFEYATLLKIIKTQEIEQKNSKCFLYLLYEGSQIIGRFNLSDVKNSNADIGYRLCQSVTNKGFASKSVNQLLQIAKIKHRLKTITATTSTVNIASIKVLEKNGFNFLFKDQKPVLLDQKKIWLNHYRKPL